MAGADTEMPAIRRLGNFLFANLLTLIGRTRVTDSASGMRVFRRENARTPAAAAGRPEPDAGDEHARRARGHPRRRGADFTTASASANRS
jgi:hypothetical protein